MNVRLVCGLVALMLSGCTRYHPAPNFCEAEGRQIPDLEMKGRLLLNMYKVQFPMVDPEYPKNKPMIRQGAAWAKLPIAIEDYLRDRKPQDANDDQIKRIFIGYVKQNPLCCQLVVDELYSSNNVMEQIYGDDQGPGFSDYFANFYLQGGGPYFEVPSSGQSGGDRRMDGLSVVGARNCGDIIIINRG